MPGISIVLDADGKWPELVEMLKDGRAQWFGATNEAHLQIAVLSAGMASGKPSIAIRIDMPDGKTIVAETSWVLLRTAHDAIRARYGSGGD